MTLFRIFAFVLIGCIPVSAQPPGGRGVAFGHVHLNSANPDAAMAFWKDVIGAATYSKGSLNGVSTLGLLILFNKNTPTGPSAGSTIDHIGLRVPDLEPIVGRLAKTTYKSFQPGADSDQLMIDGPDGVRIELIADSSVYAPLQFDHVHFDTAKPSETQAWYSKVFGGRQSPDDPPNSSRVGGAALYFAEAQSVAPSAERAIDHIAFEIKNLEDFCRKLAGEGIKFDTPYHSVPEMGFSAAFLTDPWGARIELTEGIAH